MKDNLKSFGVTESEIIFPISVLVIYLEKIKFNKDIYVISCSWIKDFLRAHGYNVKEFKVGVLGSLPGAREITGQLSILLGINILI